MLSRDVADVGSRGRVTSDAWRGGYGVGGIEKAMQSLGSIPLCVRTDRSPVMRRLFASAVLIASLFGGVALGDLVVRVRDNSGRIIQTIAVPAGGSADVSEAGPTLPTPVVTAKYLVVIRDDTPGKMTSGQLAALADADLRAKVKAAGLLYSEFPLDAIEVQMAPPAGKNYVKRMQEAKVSAPCVMLFDAAGHVLRGAALVDAPGVAAFIAGGK